MLYVMLYIRDKIRYSVILGGKVFWFLYRRIEIFRSFFKLEVFRFRGILELSEDDFSLLMFRFRW